MRRLLALTLIPMALPGLMACGDDSKVSFCELALEFENADLSGDPSSLEARVEDALVTLDRLVERAPDAIVSDVIIVRDGVEEFARGSGRLGPTFAEASQRVSGYIEQECEPS